MDLKQSLLFWGLLSIGFVDGITDEVYSRFPRLFHLDDYDSCMLQRSGLYCLGTFNIVPDHTSSLYLMLKEYSDEYYNFNRTRLYRGYCVSHRCSEPKTIESSELYNFPKSTVSAPGNSSSGYCRHAVDTNSRLDMNAFRFERCVSKYMRKHGLNVKLGVLQYCHTPQDVKAGFVLEAAHWVFLAMVALVVTMNLMGTVYDAVKKGKKSKVITSWSVLSNWQHLVGSFPDGDPRLATRLPIEAIRFFMILLVILTHTGCIHNMLYLGNPRYLESMSRRPITMFFQNGHSSIQIFILLSSFLMAQDILKRSRPPSFSLFPKLVMKRVMRISPVYLLGVGFAATWWPLVRGGPQWSPLVETESASCRYQFWPLAFFLGNFVHAKKPCLIQTWYLQVEMQLYILGLLLTLVLARVRRLALPILGTLFVLSSVGSVLLAYINHWKPLMATSGPENVRTLMSEVVTFWWFNAAPWGSAPACFAGLFVAHLLRALRDGGFRPEQHQWLIFACQLTVPLLPMWTGGGGQLFRDISSRWAHALFLGLERPVMAVLAGILLFGAMNGGRGQNTGYLHVMWGWRGWLVLGRVSLAALMLHWCINMTFAGSRATLYHSTALDMTVDFTATAGLTYLLAAPVTLLLDIPMQQLYVALTSL